MPKLTPAESSRLSDMMTSWRDARHTAGVHRTALENEVRDAVDVRGIPAREVAAAIGVSATRIYAIIRSAYARA